MRLLAGRCIPASLVTVLALILVNILLVYRSGSRGERLASLHACTAQPALREVYIYLYTAACIIIIYTARVNGLMCPVCALCIHVSAFDTRISSSHD